MPDGSLQLTTGPLPAGGTVVRVAGELDLSNVSAFEAELAALVRHGRVVVDLAECTFLDSSALRALVIAYRAATDEGAEFSLSAPTLAIRRVLEVASIDRLITVTDEVDAAQ
jgi:anti-sigma B factor antagonist